QSKSSSSRGARLDAKSRRKCAAASPAELRLRAARWCKCEFDKCQSVAAVMTQERHPPSNLTREPRSIALGKLEFPGFHSRNRISLRSTDGRSKASSVS